MARKKKSAEIIPVESEYDKLVEEILELELKLAALVEEIDDLENHVCVVLRAEYDQKVGNLEYQAQAYRLEIARLKRAIELLQAAINRQETAKYEDVQKRIEEEYGAPVFIVTTNKKGYGNAIADSACALENMMIVANALDLGSCWINQLHWLDENDAVRGFMHEYDLREDETITGGLILGYPEGEKAKVQEKKMEV